MSSMFLLLLLVGFSITSGIDRGSLPRIVSTYQKEHWLSSGDLLRLTCPVDSDPAPIITWKKDGDDIHIWWERFRIRDSVLQIKGVQVGDSGIYVCSATNGFGTVSVQYSICVLGNDSDVTASSSGTNKEFACNFNGNGEMPSFVNLHEMKNQLVQLVEGESTRLSCYASGKPKPEIRWFKNSKEILGHYNDAGRQWYLTLDDVSYADEGLYTCNVFNRVGSINYTYSVKVTGTGMNSPEFRLSILKNITASVGSVATFHCEVYSDVETHIQWMRQVSAPGQTRNPNYTFIMEDKHFTVVQRGATQVHSDGRYFSKLVISPVSVNDSGMYVCSAANTHGYRLQTAFLRILPNRDGVEAGPSRVDSEGINQFLPIVMTIASVFLLLILGIFVYLLFRRCMPSLYKRSSSASSSVTSHHCSPSSCGGSCQPRKTDMDYMDGSTAPLTHHTNQMPRSSYVVHGQHVGSRTLDTVYMLPAGSSKNVAPSNVYREHLLMPQHHDKMQYQFYEQC